MKFEKAFLKGGLRCKIDEEGNDRDCLDEKHNYIVCNYVYLLEKIMNNICGWNYSDDDEEAFTVLFLTITDKRADNVRKYFNTNCSNRDE